MKKIICAALCLLLLLSVLPIAALAADNNVFSVVAGGEFVDAWNNACRTSGTVKLERNVNIANEYNLGSGYHITIDLNGYSISGVGTSADYLFRIYGGARLTVTDSTKTAAGKIGVTVSDKDYDEVFLVEETGTLTLYAGTLKGNSDEDCRLVVVDYGTFNLYGGAVDGNTYNGDGAGVYINEGTLNMTGGAITNNHGDHDNDYGGGIYFDGSDDSRLNITGGSITNNSAYRGGGIYLDDGYAYIAGGSICDNYAEHFSAIYYDAVTMDGLELSGDLFVVGNSVPAPVATTDKNGAVGTDDNSVRCDVFLGGSLKIYGNAHGNLYLPEVYHINIKEDIDTTPEHHAWISLTNYFLPLESCYINNQIDTKGKDYSVCFCQDAGMAYPVEPFTFSDDGDPVRLGVSDEPGDLTTMELNQSAIKDEDGNTLKIDTDYKLTVNRGLCQFFIESDKYISGENATNFLRCTRTNAACKTTLVKEVSAGSGESEVRTYYYLCKNTLTADPFMEGPYQITRNVYFTVTVTCGHNFSDEWCMDETSHWRECACGAKTDEAVHTFVGHVCSSCGYAETALSIDAASLVLNGYIDIVYTAYVPAGYTDPYMTVEGPNGIRTITGYTNDGNTFFFTYAGITPQCMGDNVSATLYAAKDGQTQSVTERNYSVRQYCVNQLAKDTISARLRQLLSDILAYGAAAQTYRNYKTDALVNEGGDICDPVYSAFPGLSDLNAEFIGTAAADTCWIGAGLTLTDGVAMNFRFYAESVEGLTVQVAMDGREETFTEFTAVSGLDSVFEISFEGIKATEFGSTVTAKFFRNNVQVGNALSYSVNTYVCAKQNDTDTALAALVEALYNYGASAVNYAK